MSTNNQVTNKYDYKVGLIKQNIRPLKKVSLKTVSKNVSVTMLKEQKRFRIRNHSELA